MNLNRTWPCCAGEQTFSPGHGEVALTLGRDRLGFDDSRARHRPRAGHRTYHRLLHNYDQFVSPPGARVLEVGCVLGDLLAALKPAVGVGIDFNEEMVQLARDRHPDY